MERDNEVLDVAPVLAIQELCGGSETEMGEEGGLTICGSVVVAIVVQRYVLTYDLAPDHRGRGRVSDGGPSGGRRGCCCWHHSAAAEREKGRGTYQNVCVEIRFHL